MIAALQFDIARKAAEAHQRDVNHPLAPIERSR
jgi:hypothetical protein